MDKVDKVVDQIDTAVSCLCYVWERLDRCQSAINKLTDDVIRALDLISEVTECIRRLREEIER